MFNTLGRFLHLRGYVGEDHELTPWGRVLAAILSSDSSGADGNDEAILAVELLRLDILNGNNMFTTYTGYPVNGSGWCPSPFTYHNMLTLHR